MSRFAGNNGSHDAPPIGVSFATVSTGGAWVMMLYDARTNPLMFCPAVLQAASWNRSSCSTPSSSLPRVVLWRRTRWTLSAGGSFHTHASFAALSAGSSASGTLRISALLLAQSTGPMMSLHVILECPSGSPLKSRQTFYQF